MKLFGEKFFLFLICLQLRNVRTEEDVEESITPELHRIRRSAKSKPFVIDATELTEKQHEFYVDFHNLKRSQVQPPAEKMLKLVFDQGLADLAKNYSRKCIYDHSPEGEAATDKFSQAGENLFVTSQVSSNLSAALQRGIHLWFQEKNYYTYETRKCQKGKVCGHYTEMVWAENRAIGCGATTCGNILFRRKTKPRMQLVVCNYGPGGNFYGESPYVSGASCSACPNKDKCACARPDSPTTKTATTTLATTTKSTTTTIPITTTTQKPNKLTTTKESNKATTTKESNKATTTTKAPGKPITTTTKKEVKKSTTSTPTKTKDPKDTKDKPDKKDKENNKDGDGNGSSSIFISTFYIWFVLFPSYYTLVSL